MSASGVIDLLTQSAAEATCRAVWALRLAGEDDLPARRIIHARIVRVHRPVKLLRLGVRRVESGYAKCGSVAIPDWVISLRVHAWDGTAWQTVIQRAGLPELAKDQMEWIDLDGLETAAVMIEARRCGIDLGWTGWNLAAGAFVLEGEPLAPADVKDESFQVESVELGGCPRGVEALALPGEVRYRTRWLEVGFRLSRAGFAYLDVDDEGKGRTHRNVLHLPSLMGFSRPNDPLRAMRDLMSQGLRLRPVGVQTAVGLLEQAAGGVTTVCGNVVTYNINIPAAGQRYTLRWEVLEDHIELSAERVGTRALRAWDSCAWQMALHSVVTPTASLGRITRQGEAGLMRLPLLLHAPGHGTLRVETDSPAATWRSDSCRPLNTTTAELKLGETATPLGDYVLEPGRHHAQVRFTVMRQEIPVRDDTPPAVRRGLNRCGLTSLTYRPDTATFTNNANSIHAIICADCWSATSTRIGDILPDFNAAELLRDTLERWLDGGPGYAGGGYRDGGGQHDAEDEYIMTGTAALLGLADYLRYAASAAWAAQYAPPIRAQLQRMLARDLDGDGIVESPYRLGISGQHQWSTCWYDVISFGWKDAFANALLYAALTSLATHLPRLGQPQLAMGLTEWAARLKANYWPMFFNEQTGWLAGWRCKENKLHDHGYLFVNGAAINADLLEGRQARDIVTRMWEEMMCLPTIDFRLGMPGALRLIPYDDLATPMASGMYMNMTLTHSQSRHFLGAMYKVGMMRQADAVLEKLCESLGDGTAFGGCGTGVDWRRWDGQPSGYEGMLSDQFGVLAIALDRYGTR